MYEKMIQIDPNAPTEEEHIAKGVTKPRYMVSFEFSVFCGLRGVWEEGLVQSTPVTPVESFHKQFSFYKTK